MAETSKPKASPKTPAVTSGGGGGAAGRVSAYLRGLRLPPDASLFTGLVLAVAVVSVAWPLWSCEWLPFVDYPEHVGTVGAIHGIHGPAFAPYYTVDYAGSQYLLFYVASDIAAYVLGVEQGTRFVVVLSLALLPIAVAAFLRANGRPMLPAALSACVAIHVFVFWGFVNYAMGATLAIAALAALTWLVRKPTTGRAVWFGVLSLLTFYAHAQLYAWMAFASLVVVLGMARTAGSKQALAATWRAGVAAVPSMLATWWWVRSSSVLESGEGALRSGNLASPDGGAEYARASDTLRAFFDHSFAFYSDGTGDRIALVFLAAVLVIIVLRGARSLVLEPSLDAERWSRTLAPEAVLLFTIAAWLFAPHSYKLIGPINDRFLSVALALLPVLAPTVPLRLLPRVSLGVLAVVATLWVGRAHARKFHETDEEMGSLGEALSHTRPGKKLLGLVFDRQSAVVPFVTYMHSHQYYQARVGGLAAWSFVELPKSPVKYREDAAPPPFPPRFEWAPERFVWGTWGEYFDYFLIRTAPNRPAPNMFPLGAPNSPELIYDSPRWHLYAKRSL